MHTDTVFRFIAAAEKARHRENDALAGNMKKGVTLW